jgi:uncharacterized membrane protein (DUF4010 family)
MNTADHLPGLLTALGVGLMIGVVRERSHPPDKGKAGTRTHALVALLGYVAWGFGLWPFVATLLVIGALVIGGYRITARSDPGQTGEVALLVTLMLSALAQQNPVLAAGLGVLTAVLLYAKRASQRISRELITEQELQDGLMLAAAALVVMPVLSSEPVDPWGVLRLTTLWRIVVLVMAVGMFGHVAQRALGARWGMPVAGFFSGFASSTAAVASMGQRVKGGHLQVLPAAAAALLSNLASLLLLAGVVGTVSPPLLQSLRESFILAALGLLGAVALCLRRDGAGPDIQASGSAFKLMHALIMAGMIALMSVLAGWLRSRYGDAGVLLAAVGVAWVEVHAAVTGVAQLMQTGEMPLTSARWGVIAVLASSAVAKTVLAVVSGGPRYGLVVGLGLLSMVGAASVPLVWLF